MAQAALYEKKLGFLLDMLVIAQEQLSLATSGTDEDLDKLDAATARRDELIAKVNELDAQIASIGMQGREKETDALIARLRETLLEIDRCDGQTRDAIRAMLDSNSAEMRTMQKTRQGVNAYMGAQNQVDSLYIDQKK